MSNESNSGRLFPARPSLGQNVLWIASIALLYFAVARLSLSLVFQPAGIAAIWPPAGIFLSAILLTRRNLRPWLVGVLCITDLIAELLTGTPWVVSLIYALALTGDAVLSSWLLIRFVGEPITFRRVREVVGWLLLSVILSNALISLVAAAASTLLPGTSFWNSWKWWAASDGIGNLLVTPLILSWAAWGRSRLGVWNPKRVLEGAALFILLALLNYIAFNYLAEQGLFSLLLTYLTFPFLLWAAIRFGVHGVASASVILAGIAIYFAAAGRVTNVFLQVSPLDIVITVQLYLAIMAAPALFLAAVVTERRQAEDALRETEERLRAIVSNTPDHILMQDNQLRYVFVVNPQLGLTEQDMIGKTDYDFLSKEEGDKLTKVKRQVIETGEPLHFETSLISREGNPEFFDGTYVPKCDAQGKIDGLIGYFRNVTERKKTEEMLQKEKEKAQTYLDIAGVIMVAIDADQKVTLLNKRGCEVLGYTAHEIIGKNWFDTFLPEWDRERVKTVFDQLMAGKIEPVEYFENLVLIRDGEEKIIAWHNTVLRDEDGNIVGTLSSGEDITERKQAEEALWESEEKFSKAFHSNPAMLVLTTLDGKNLDVNQAYADFLGYSREEILGKNVVNLQIVSVEERQKILELIQRGGGSVHNAEIVVRVRDGSLRHILFSADVISLGSVPHRLTTLLDITERKKAEEERRIINEELLAINRIITTTTTTTTTGVKGILEKVLDEALYITGLEGGTICMVTPDETLNLAVHRETSEATILDLTTNQIKIGECLCGECARDHKPLILWDREAVLKFSSREAQRGEDIRFHAALPLITGGRCVGVLCVFTRTDKKPFERRLKLLETITSQIAIALENARLYEETTLHAAILEDRVKERTAELSDSQGALMNLVEDLNIKSSEIEKANLRLQELDQLKSMFIASMSHELRTPLNSIIGFTGILLQGMAGELNDEQQDQLRRVQASGKHLLELINDVIDISKIEAGKLQTYVSEFSLATVIDQAVAALKGEIAHKGLDLEIGLPEDVTLNTDRRRLLQCVLNLLSNAVKYTEKGAVRLSARVKSEDEGLGTRDEKSSIEISVADTGIGIREEDLPLLFAPFTRLESPLKVKNPGTGLGLYLTKKITVELLGGSVVAQSKPGVGSTFTLIIPKTLSGGEIK